MYRIFWLDVCRAGLIISMIIFHFHWDLVYFRLSHNSDLAKIFFFLLGRLTAIGFLFIAGFSLHISYLKHTRKQFNYHFLIRLLKIMSAATLITIITYLLFYDNFIYFGILHEICFSSILLFFLLKRSAYFKILLAIVILIAGYSITNLYFSPYMTWLGLCANPRSSFDYVPVFPWAGYALIGNAFAQLIYKQQKINLISTPVRKNTYISFLSKHSLAIYLLHQPILLCFLTCFNVNHLNQEQIFTNNFLYACQAECRKKNSSNYCKSYCYCIENKLSTKTKIKTAIKQCKANGNY